MREIQVTQYQANDGAVFDSAEQALDHEAVQALEQMLCRADAPKTEAYEMASYLVANRAAIVDVLCTLDIEAISEDTPAHGELVLREVR